MDHDNAPHPPTLEELLAPLRHAADTEVGRLESAWGPDAISQAHLAKAQADLAVVQAQLCLAKTEKEKVITEIVPYEAELGVDERKAATMMSYVEGVTRLIDEGQETLSMSAELLQGLKKERKARNKDIAFLQFQIRKKKGVLVGLCRTLRQVTKRICGLECDIAQREAPVIN